MSAADRLLLARESGLLTLPETGRIAVFGPVAGQDLSALPQDRCDLITTFKPDVVFFDALDWSCLLAPEGDYALGIVCAARAKALSLARIAAAAKSCAGPVAIDGVKTDGIEALLKACRGRGTVSAPLSKAHGKFFVFSPEADLSDWEAGPPAQIAGGFVTAPGVFSSDWIDPGSAALLAALPPKLGARVADLGAGWGYLSAGIAQRPGLTDLHLVEADHLALDCARCNVTTDVARFHWADATRWEAPEPLDSVVMNPPFHAGRAADPTLGRAFIASAARALSPRGTLYMVANRHLPYEADLERLFGRVELIGQDPGYKVFQASRPARTPR